MKIRGLCALKKKYHESINLIIRFRFFVLFFFFMCTSNSHRFTHRTTAYICKHKLVEQKCLLLYTWTGPKFLFHHQMQGKLYIWNWYLCWDIIDSIFSYRRLTYLKMWFFFSVEKLVFPVIMPIDHRAIWPDSNIRYVYDADARMLNNIGNFLENKLGLKFT